MSVHLREIGPFKGYFTIPTKFVAACDANALSAETTDDPDKVDCPFCLKIIETGRRAMSDRGACPPRRPTGDRLAECRQKDPVVQRLLRAGAPLGDIIAVLSDLRAELMKRVMELESIAPKRIKTPDGSVYMWKCPADLVPIRAVEPGDAETPGTVETPESVGRQPVKCSCGAETTLTLLRSVAASTTPARYWAADDPAWRFRTGLGWSCGVEDHQQHVEMELGQAQKDSMEAFRKASGIVFVARTKNQDRLP